MCSVILPVPLWMDPVDSCRNRIYLDWWMRRSKKLSTVNCYMWWCVVCYYSFHKLLSFGYFWTCTGLLRCGKSCRLRWTNYLRPEIKRGPFTTQEEKLVIQLHGILGNRSNIFSNSIQFNLFHSNSWMFLLSPSSDGQQLHLNSREEQTMRSRIYGTLISKSAWS